MRHAPALVFALAVLLNAPALADDRQGRDSYARLEPQLLFGGMIRDSDVTLLFDYLRQSMAAAARGDQPPPQEELRRRAEALGHDLRTRGALAALMLLNALEASAREALCEPAPRARPLPPPTVPFVPVRD